MSGRRGVGLPRVRARCAVDIKTSKDLTEFVRVRLEREGDAYLATPTGGQGSGIFSSISRAHGLLIGPSSETVLKAGAQATVLLLGVDGDGGGIGGMGAVAGDELFEGRTQSQ
jgi:molybdopterin biosynthesis enzyme